MESEFKTKLLRDAAILKDWTEMLVRDLQSEDVVSAIIITTLSETTCNIAYNTGRFNQQVIGARAAHPGIQAHVNTEEKR